MSTRPRGLFVAVALGSLLLSGCGSSLPHSAFVAAGEGRQQSLGQAGSGSGESDGNGVTAGDGGGTTGLGTSTGAGGTSSGAGGSTGSGTAAATSTGGGTTGGSTGSTTGTGTGSVTGRPGASSTAPIIIGSVGDYSGVAGTAEGQGPVGLQVWAQDLNARGGINGRPVKVIVADDGSDPSKAQSEVQDLVENQHVIAFAANIATYTIPQQLNYLEPHKIPVIGGDCGLPIWNNSPVLFTQCASVDTTYFMGMKIGAKYGKSKKLGLLYCAEAAVCTAANEADSDGGKGYAKANGLQIVYSNEFSLTQPDFTQQCIAMRQAGVGLVNVVGDPNVQARVAAACARQNYSPQFLAGSALVSPALRTTTGFSDLITEMSTLPFDGLTTPAAKKFRQAFATYAPKQDPGPAGSLGWTSGLILEKALRAAAAAPGGVISSATIIKGLYTIKNDTMGGASVPLTYTAGHNSADFNCEFVLNVVNGKWVAPQGDTPVCRS